MISEFQKDDEKIEGDSKKSEAPQVTGEIPQQMTAKGMELTEFDLTKQLEMERQRAEECFKRLMYLQADFENYRKRVDGQIAQLKQFSNERLVVDLLSVIDELELAIKSAKASKDCESIVTGLEMVLKKFQDVLGKEGLSRIEAVNVPFDPNLHEVVSRVPVAGKPEGMIVEEVRVGYMLRGKVIRPSIVTVASAAPSEGGVST